MKRFVLTAILAVCVLMLPAAPVRAAACHFALGFATLHDLLPVQVGQCIDDASYTANGDAVQHTTGGLLVWKKPAPGGLQWTAFTDGYRTWVNGPFGLQERLNSRRFSWEAGGTPAATSMPSAPEPARSLDAGIVITPIGAKVLAIAANATVLTWVRNENTLPTTAYLATSLTDASGHVIGQATGVAQDIQPGATKMAVLTSALPIARVVGIVNHLEAAVPGSSLPASIVLSGAHLDPANPTAILVTVHNGDMEGHSGSFAVALVNADGSLAGYAEGQWESLPSGETTVATAVAPNQAIPVGARFTPQVTAISHHIFAVVTVATGATIYCDGDPAWPTIAGLPSTIFSSLRNARAAYPTALLHAPC